MDPFLNLAGSAAHDMNKPLTVIKHHVNLLLSQIPDEAPPTVRESLETLRESTEHLADTVEKIAGLASRSRDNTTGT